MGTNGGTPVTNLLIASVGDPDFNVSAWLRYHLLNGNPGIYGYVEQYWDKAYKAETNGNPTSVETGILSPYGEFFPTEPGNVALVTRTNIENGLTGTGIVHVVSLNVDANHDSTMDFTYNGPDFVSPSKPFRFWVNDNQDWSDDTGDGIPGKGAQADGLMQVEVAVGGPYYATMVNRWAVHGRRDLVDFFPVCINIGSLFQSNALSAGISAADTNFTFVLSQADNVLRFAYTDLTPTNYMDFLRDTNESGRLANTELTTITNDGFHFYNGIPLSSAFLSGIAASNQSIILVEAAAPTTQPLVLTIYHGTNRIAQTQLPLSITGVEQMFRSKTMLLRPLPGQVPDRLTDDLVPNEPDTIAKNFVFLHGYNVLPNEARGVAADTFKRLYWSGSHAKFYAVTWQGADSKGTFPFYDLFTPNYHTNVENAFLTAPMLADFIATLTNSGPIVASAHSLGNMVVLDAISDYNAPISQYFMLDAAVPIEAIDPTAITNLMIYSTWAGYNSRLFASDWYQLFPTNDARSTLSWNNRLGNWRNVDIYNCYSSGEEVLRTTTNDPPAGVLGMVAVQGAYHIWDGFPFGSFTWYWQEKGKGTSTQDWFLGSTSGGWGFNSVYGTNVVDYFTGQTEFIPMSPSASTALTSAELQTNAFFGWYHGDVALQGTGGSSYAQTYRHRILADAIPAMSLVAGANPIPAFSPPQSPSENNVNMMTLENGWARGRTGPEVNMWHHSDFHDMAYTFTYRLFDDFVSIGNLK